jgi:hypothetical protein
VRYKLLSLVAMALVFMFLMAVALLSLNTTAQPSSREDSVQVPPKKNPSLEPEPAWPETIAELPAAGQPELTITHGEFEVGAKAPYLALSGVPDCIAGAEETPDAGLLRVRFYRNESNVLQALLWHGASKRSLKVNLSQRQATLCREPDRAFSQHFFTPEIQPASTRGVPYAQIKARNLKTGAELLLIYKQKWKSMPWTKPERQFGPVHFYEHYPVGLALEFSPDGSAPPALAFLNLNVPELYGTAPWPQPAQPTPNARFALDPEHAALLCCDEHLTSVLLMDLAPFGISLEALPKTWPQAR